MTKDIEAEVIEANEEKAPTSEDEGKEPAKEIKEKDSVTKTPKSVSTSTEKGSKKKVKKLSQKDYEKKVIELAGTGLTSEKIGQKLRDEGIHPNDYEGKISKILGEKYINPDLKNVEEKYSRIEKHFESNKQDKRAKREKNRIFSQIRKLKKYFGIEIIKKRNMKKVRK